MSKHDTRYTGGAAIDLEEPAEAGSPAAANSAAPVDSQSVAAPDADEFASGQRPGAEPEAAQATVGETIRRFRVLRNITQRELSRAMGHRTPEWTGLLESGNRVLDLDKAPDMAGVLKINGQDFVKHCLYQYYPRAADVLFGAPTDAPIREDHKRREVVRLDPEIYEIARRLQNLPRATRETIGQLIVNLEYQQTIGNRDRDDRPIPVTRVRR